MDPDTPFVDPELGSIPAVKQFDYFGVPEPVKFMMPDGISFLMLQPMLEGDRRKYLNLSNRGVKINKADGSTEFDLKPGDDRFNLLRMSIVGWNLTRGGSPVPFTLDYLVDFLSVVNPSIADDIEKKVREINPWLTSEQNADDVRAEIERLQEVLAKLEEDELGK